MIRKQIYIESRQDALLKQWAQRLHMSEAELIRRGIDRIADLPVSLLPDGSAWKEERTYIEEHRRMTVPQTGRNWSREELYDERLERSSY